MNAPSDEALQYLRRTATVHPSQGFTYLHPFENFETAWVLDALAPLVEGNPLAAFLLDRLDQAWTEMGMAWSTECEVTDGDDTAVTLALLTRAGRIMGTQIFELYETPDYFQTFVFERNPSVTTNAHILLALRQYPSTPERRRMIVKIVNYLRAARGGKAYWDDKWHASPYYATDRALAALSGLAPELVRPAVEWILGQQHDDGSWGGAGGNDEETAWAVHALISAVGSDMGLKGVAQASIEKAAQLLAHRLYSSNPYPALWIGKGLYAAPLIVRSVVVGALARWLDLNGRGS
jgi:halimadienyl-diphosphate synthase